MVLTSIIERVRDWRERRTALAELRQFRRIEEAYAPSKHRAILTRIKAAAFENNPEAAVKAWHEMHACAPDLAMTSPIALRSLIDLKLFDMTDEIIVKAMTKFSHSGELADMYAEVAQRRGMPEEASQRWEQVRRSFPERQRGYILGAICLKDLQRYDEAEALLERAIAMEPDDRMAASHYAEIADMRGDVEEALRRWELMRERMDDVQSWVESAKHLHALNRTEDALKLLNKARWRFQASSRPSIELAAIAYRQGDIDNALRQWKALRENFPQESMGYNAAANALRDLGRLDEAERILLAGADRIMHDPGPIMDYARLVHGRDWPEAARRWAMVRERFPALKEGYTWGADALEQAGQTEEAARVRAGQP